MYILVYIMTTTLQTRIDTKLKKDAKKALEAMGLDMSTSIKMFLTQVVRTNSIPFAVTSADELSVKEKRILLNETADALKHGKSYKNARDLHRAILK